MKSYDESKPFAERGRDVPSTDESPKDGSNQNINIGGPQSLSIGEWPRYLSVNLHLDAATQKI